MSNDLLLEAEQILKELESRKKRNSIDQYFPDTGPLRRELYAKHMEFFRAGKNHTEILALCGNRVGKTTTMGGYEVVLHMTGQYPEWWEGRKFDKPVQVWAGGDTTTTVRDILQLVLLGNIGEFGTGLIRGDLLMGTTNKRGLADAVENIYVKHVSGGKSVMQLKSYDQGREAWQGTAKDIIWLDEEPPLDIYTEAYMRIMTTSGMIMNTYTPVEGMGEVTQMFMDADKSDDKFLLIAGWKDCPHITPEMMEKFLEGIPPHQREARSTGIPTIGAGKIYPVSLEDIICEPFKIPEYWPKSYGMDVGWNRTAALWGALDYDSDILYLYSEHYMGEATPAAHASAIKARGEMTGFIDPASRGRSQHDGQQLLQLYKNEGLELELADNAVEAGIFDVYQRMISGRIKIFSTLGNLLKELPMYRRDNHGKIVKKNDHLCDCVKYLTRAIPRMTYAISSKQVNYATTSSGVTYITSRPRRKYSS
jgi:phage terminase large subunit-like protein